MYQRRLSLAAAATFAVGALVSAQEQTLPQFSSGVELVEVYATVTDEKGAVVTNLRREDFEVYENDQRQEISAFAFGEFPLTVALGVDRSWSMAGRPLDLAKQASRSFLDQLKPADRSMVVAVSSAADVIAPLSKDRAAQSRAISALDPWSTTSLRDALVAVLDHLAPEPGRQAAVFFSDGNDRYSTATEGEVLERVRRSNALIYPIVIGERRPSLLAEAAVLSGGRSFLLKDAKDLTPTLTTIARELRFQYLLGYVPSQAVMPGSRQWRSIRVMLRTPRPGVRARARDGYMRD